MFKIYRMPEKGEFFCIGADCSQGGEDSNHCHFLSKNKIDIPIVYSSQGVAATMTSDVHPFFEWLFDVTGIPPVVAFERQNGGASEMERLSVLNRNNKYTLFIMPKLGINSDVNDNDTNRFGWDTNVASRPTLVSEWKDTIDHKLVRVYDEETIAQHRTFIVNKQGKPEASKGKHDDAVIAPAIAWQLYQRCTPKVNLNYIVPKNDISKKDWSLIG